MGVIFGVLLLSAASASWAAEPASLMLRIAATSGDPAEAHVVTLNNVDLSTYAAGNAPSTHPPPEGCSLRFTMAHDGAVNVEENKQCPALAEAARAWSYTVADVQFESIQWALEVFDLPTGVVLGVPVDMLKSKQTLPTFAREFEALQPKKRVAPRFPRSALRGQAECSCSVKVDVSTQGKVVSAELQEAPVEQCPEVYGERAVAAARKWTFKPRRIGEKTYEDSFTMKFKFKEK